MLQRHRDRLLRTLEVSLLEEHVGQSVPAVPVCGVEFDLSNDSTTLL